MAAVQEKKSGHGISVYVGNDAHGVSLAARGTRTRSHGVDIYTYGEVQARRRVAAQITVSDEINNTLFGIFQPQDVSISTGNLDGELSYLARVDVRGSLYRITRVDADEHRELAQGLLQGVDVGDEVVFRGSNHDLEILDTELPKHRVVTAEELELPEGIDAQDVTATFIGAPDQNAPVNIIAGRVEWVPCAYINADDINSHWDYLVCEGYADVEAVQKDYQPAYTETGVAVDGIQTSLTLDASTIPRPQGYYVGLVLRVMRGENAGLERVITGHDAATGSISFAALPGNGILPNDLYEIREYQTLAGTVYKGRTVIRFNQQRQVDPNGSIKAITATVVRYRPVRKNALCKTDRPSGERFFWTANVGTPSRCEGPDNLTDSAERLTPTAGTAATTTQATTSVLPGTSGQYTFSVWLRAPISHNVRLTIQRVNGTDTSSLDVTATTTWTRFSVTKSAWLSSSSPARVVITSLVNGRVLDIFGAQLEPGLVPTYYEPVNLPGQGALFSFPDFIGELLTEPFWGLGQQVDPTSIETCNETLSGLFLRCQGLLPTLSGEVRTAKDIFDELLSVRGFVLRRSGSAWRLDVDAPGKTDLGTVGTAETPYEQILELGPIKQKDGGQTVKTLKIEYGESLDKEGQPYFPWRLPFSVFPKGIEEVWRHQFIRDHNSADRSAQYRRGWMLLNDHDWNIAIGQVGRNLLSGDVISVVAPRRQPANLLARSEEFHDGTWIGAPARSPAHTPERRSTRGQWLQQSDLLSQYMGNFVCNGRDVIFNLWARAETAVTTLPLSILVGLTVWKTESPTVGLGWKRYQVRTQLPNDGLTQSIGVRIDPGAGSRVAVWAAQGCLDYEYPYIRTEATRTPPQNLWRVGSGRRQLERVDLTLCPYDESVLFAYTKSSFPTPATDSSDVDYRLLAPDPPTDLSVPPSPGPGVVTAAAGIDQSTDGVSDSWAEIRFRMPMRGAVHVDVQRRKVTDTLWEPCGRIEADEVGPGQVARVLARTFTPGLRYAIRAVAVGSSGKSSVSTTQPEFVAWGDQVPPPTPTSLSVTQGTGKSVQINVGLPTVRTILTAPNGVTFQSDKIIDDFAYIQLFKHTVQGNPNSTPSFQPTMIDRSSKQQFHDVVVTPNGATLYYWARAEDYTGNVSRYFPETGGTSIAPQSIEERIVFRQGASGAAADFVDLSGVVRARLKVSAGDAISWDPIAHGTDDLFFGQSISAWRTIVMRATDDGQNATLLMGDFGLVGPAIVLSASHYGLSGAMLKTGGSFSSTFNLPPTVLEVRNAAGSVIGYIPIYAGTGWS